MTLIIENHGKTTQISFNRPDRLNAIDSATAFEVQEAFQDFEASDQRVVVLTGVGETFCSGADVKDLPELWRCIPGIGFQLSKPLILAPSGWCVGGAMVMAMKSDLLIASDTTKFFYPEAYRGFTGGMIAGLAARIPHKIAMEVMFMGESLTAQRAYEVGFVNRVTPNGEHVNLALEWADRIGSAAPMVLELFKSFVNTSILPEGPSEKAASVNRDIARIKSSRDRDEGLLALRQKRSPVFEGR
ncbi:enoyl-CoA hydratase-related protein [Rhizobium sp. BR 315]|uniref:enoyl-CoA hydratase-related protein n=1 Tax=Rhizobium sp. BR 315 TaxID=3040014 RepID=UPI003D32F9AA